MGKSILMALIIGFLFQACQPPATDLGAKKALLQEKQGQLNALQSEIKSLKTEIDELDSTVKEDKRTLVIAKKPSKEEFKHYIQIPGRADSRQNIVVSAESMGNITKIYRQEGTYVKKGDLIASIESDVIGTQIAELKTRLDFATELYNKQKRLWDQKIGSEVQYLQAKNNKESLEKSIASLRAQQRNSSITSPITGYLDRVFIREGQLVNMGTQAARIVDLKNIRVEVEVSEAYIGKFEKGDTIDIQFPSIKETFRVPIKTIGQVVNADDRTFMVEAEVNNKDRKIKPNVLANVHIVTYQNPETYVLKTSVVQQGRNGDYVFVIEEKNGETFAKKQVVEVGMTYEGKTEVVSGITNKDIVITVGGRSIADGDPVRVKK